LHPKTQRPLIGFVFKV